MKMLAIYMKKLQIITSLLNHARDQAGSAYVKLAECHLKVGQKIRSVIVYMEEMITKCWQWRDGWVIGTNQDIKSGSIPFLVFFFLYFKFGAKNPFSQLVL
ncbi:uncharacterized protein [Rutidosis leptorrhynchoides]|uniref:uncharacterized protein isoform X6 n=1 Tax=Rutidosis leptorrhynchoides TaxID=125765 RepID=UPI003A990058